MPSFFFPPTAVNFSLPLEDPIMIFFVVLSVILFAPILFKAIRIPGVIGLILSGVAIGPKGLNLLQRDNSIVLFGTVGLLYIMFTAGLEIDLTDFKKNRNKSMIFGFLTFIIPMAMGIPAVYYLLDFSLLSSILLASLLASHTLLAYPIVSKLGVSKTDPVNITVGGTLITDTASLLVLAFITGSSKGDINTEFWLTLAGSTLLFGITVIFGFPFIGRWFFRSVQDSVSQYIFVIAMVFFGGFLAELAGLEPIIGAFLSGLALNRLIPHTSPLMNRIDFVGSAIFIPFFLISVGMLVDLKVLFLGTESIYTAIIMITVGLASKWIAAFIAQKLFNYNSVERGLIFGLSSARVAATLAAALVGYKLGFLNENVLNGSILMILVSCLVSSFVAEKNAKLLAMQEENKEPDLAEISERILVPISNPKTIEQLINLAVIIRNQALKQPIYALSVVRDNDEVAEKVLLANKMLEKVIKHASATETEAQVITRVDLNIANGILRASKDLVASDILIGWNAKITAKDKIFGSVLDIVLRKSPQMIWVCKWEDPINVIKNIVVVVPKNSEYESGFAGWISRLKKISKELGSKLIFYCDPKINSRIERELKKSKSSIDATFEEFSNLSNIKSLQSKIGKDDLLVAIQSRRGSVSFNLAMEDTPRLIAKYFSHANFIFLYPDSKGLNDNDIHVDEYEGFIGPIQENVERIRKFADFFRNIFKKEN
ncbi:cation:proton antiporter [Leptospira sp. GIMC2001]|uniref:cation:proton antiporter n=1 Tax=Leptospira sp. GIMC2001 TaxID=1513297 RepID=UPI002349B571|nr:cation:proton antiporter [Leptospira sp. GIMC2001]WCL49957.1 cation:proton antiporter [Leptospira sp. GIMC2001]